MKRIIILLVALSFAILSSVAVAAQDIITARSIFRESLRQVFDDRRL